MNADAITSSSSLKNCNGVNESERDGMGEKKWIFKENGIATYDFGLAPDGAEYSCNKFSPACVSFDITYYPNDAMPVIDVGGTGEVIRVKDGLITVKAVLRMDITLWGGGVYTIKNITGQEVLGTECDTGAAPHFRPAGVTMLAG
ncbi:hypothetical protein [Acerihabitans arboris]|uniref:Uncharacterized protein n=1 Tax=Acerihabitans arboris TaxID=2691583 RepID=A0A845SLW0_9GAMM|nr:hypothetical protein [Acerihabitans arboris]NDL64372.1 hypothetical protein [Acerihabitans arboris]